jgi:hypothetical protein
MIDQNQKQFFEYLGSLIPPHLSLVDELRELFGVSKDSVYRRVRGETPCTFAELSLISKKYPVSIDTFMGNESTVIPCTYHWFEEESFTFEKYLQGMKRELKFASAQEEVEVIYLTNDLTIFQLMQFPEIAAFKSFFWQKTAFNFPSFRNKTFSLDSIKGEWLQSSREIVEAYLRLPTIEVVGQHAILNMLAQIQYYQQQHFFDQPEDAAILCKKLKELIQHVKSQAEQGKKFLFGEKPAPQSRPYRLFYNTISSVDSVILSQIGPLQLAHLSIFPPAYLRATHPSFLKLQFDQAKAILSHSVELTGLSEVHRNPYFETLLQQVEHFEEELPASV